MDKKMRVPFKEYFPQLSVSSYFWTVILVSMIIFSIIGYFVGIRMSKSPSSVVSSNHDPYDIDYSNISGSFIIETNKYDQFVVHASALQPFSNSDIDADNRSFDNPHVGVEYPYMFSRLDPFHAYAISASACYTDPKTYAIVCAKNITVTKCSGTIQGSTCIIKGNGIELQSNGEVNFLLLK